MSLDVYIMTAHRPSDDAINEAIQAKTYDDLYDVEGISAVFRYWDLDLCEALAEKLVEIPPKSDGDEPVWVTSLDTVWWDCGWDKQEIIEYLEDSCGAIENVGYYYIDDDDLQWMHENQFLDDDDYTKLMGISQNYEQLYFHLWY